MVLEVFVCVITDKASRQNCHQAEREKTREKGGDQGQDVPLSGMPLNDLLLSDMPIQRELISVLIHQWGQYPQDADTF